MRKVNQIDYSSLFDGQMNENRMFHAYTTAKEQRDLEIKYYWDRSKYFWTFVAIIFVAFFSYSTSESKSISYEIMISGLGLTFSLAWYLINRASKYWHSCWDRKLESIENDVVGPLQKSLIDFNDKQKNSLTSEYPFSVTRINLFLSIYVIFIWSFIFLKSISELFNIYEPFQFFNALILVVGTAIIISKLLWKSSIYIKDLEATFIVREIKEE